MEEQKCLAYCSPRNDLPLDRCEIILSVPEPRINSVTVLIDIEWMSKVGLRNLVSERLETLFRCCVADCAEEQRECDQTLLTCPPKTSPAKMQLLRV